MEEKDTKRFMGQGFHFPFAVNRQTGKILMSAHEENIHEAIGIILNTNVGERVMHMDFGSTANDYVFSVNHLENITSFESDILTAIQTYEPRVYDVEVKVSTEDGDKSKAVVHISYVVRTTNNRFNKVYPFYLLEGTEATTGLEVEESK